MIMEYISILKERRIQFRRGAQLIPCHISGMNQERIARGVVYTRDFFQHSKQSYTVILGAIVYKNVRPTDNCQCIFCVSSRNS